MSQPRYGRIAALLSACAVTAVAMLGGTGVLPSMASGSPRADLARDTAPTSAPDPSRTSAQMRATSPAPSADAWPSSSPSSSRASDTPTENAAESALPADSGTGKRVVFSQDRQRVWLVEGDKVQRTYLVSGSVYDNLDPGTYSVFSRSEHAYGIDDSGTMRYFVRFTRGENAAIGFHDIPVDDGRPVQTKAQLGTPLSHGCIRQHRPDAIALWDFAPIGTSVVVTA